MCHLTHTHTHIAELKWDRKRKANGCSKSEIIIVCLLPRTENDWWREMCTQSEMPWFSIFHRRKKKQKRTQRFLLGMVFRTKECTLPRTQPYPQHNHIILERLYRLFQYYTHMMCVKCCDYGGHLSCGTFPWTVSLFSVILILQEKKSLLFESYSPKYIIVKLLQIVNGFPVKFFQLGHRQLKMRIHVELAFWKMYKERWTTATKWWNTFDVRILIKLIRLGN